MSRVSHRISKQLAIEESSAKRVIKTNEERLAYEAGICDKFNKKDVKELGRHFLDLFSAFANGEVQLDSKRLMAIKSLVSQLVPNAGTNINLNVQRPEEYIAKAMEDNVGAYAELLALSEQKALALRDGLERDSSLLGGVIVGTKQT